MKSADMQRQIESMQNTLKKVKESATLSANDPALVQLERIMQRKVEELAIAKAEEGESLSHCILFAEIDR